MELGRRAPRSAVFLLLLACAGLACRRAERPTHLVLVVVDTLRADRLSLYGHDCQTSPALDRWARGGAVFERAWSTSSWTLPSMSMLLTGQPQLNNSGRIRDEQTPLAERLAAAGYRTGAVVANRLLRPGLSYDRGFESYDKVHRENGIKVRWRARDVLDRGLAWLDERDGRPCFLYLHFMDPHTPYVPQNGLQVPIRNDPAVHAAMLERVTPEERALLDDAMYRRIESRRAMYDSEIVEVDRMLGELFAYLEESGLARDTLVVVTADHGEGLWTRPQPPGEDRAADSFFPPLYQKHGVQLFTEQVHVPLVLRGPGVPAGRRSYDVSLVDLAPTIYRLLGVAPPPGLSGHDLFADGAREPVFSICSRSVTVTVDGRWRLHRPSPEQAELYGLSSKLYDLVSDPTESTPLDDPQRTAELEALLDAWIERYRHTASAPSQASPEHLQDLRDLGYAGEAERLEQEQRRERAGRDGGDGRR